MATPIYEPGESNILSQSRPRLQRRLLLSSHAARTAMPGPMPASRANTPGAALQPLASTTAAAACPALRGVLPPTPTRLSAGDDTRPIPSLIRLFSAVSWRPEEGVAHLWRHVSGHIACCDGRGYRLGDYAGYGAAQGV